MKTSSLYALTESAKGFAGGSCVDEMPHLSITECAGALTESLLTEQLELHESALRTNDALVEAAVNALQMGGQANFDSIVEASFADLKSRIARIFDKILKFLKSIIAKVVLQINKIRMTGHQLYERYKNAPQLKNKSFKDMTVSGYKFSTNGALFPSMDKYFDNAEGLIQKVGEGKVTKPDSFRTKYKTEVTSGSDTEKAAQKAIDDLKDISRATRVVNMAKELTGMAKLSEGSWQSDLKEELYGEKVDLKYGTDFTLDSLAELLKEPKNLTYIKDEYGKLQKGVEAYKKKLDTELTDLEKEKSPDNKTEANNGLSLVTGYYSAYISFVEDAYSVINTVQSIKWNFENEKIKQAKMLFGKMLSYKEPKNEGADDSEDTDDFDLED